MTAVSFVLETGISGLLTVEARSLDFNPMFVVSRVEPDSTRVLVGEGSSGDRAGLSRLGLDAEGGARYRIEVQPAQISYCGGDFEVSVTAGKPEPFDPKAREEVNRAYWQRVEEKASGKERPECVVEALLRRWNPGADEKSAQAAKPGVDKALALAEERLGPEHPLVARSLAAEGTALTRLGSFSEAKSVLERALVIQEEALGADHPAVAATLWSLADVLRYTQDHAGAKDLLERVLKINERFFGPNHSQVARSLHQLGLQLWRMGEYAQAKPLFERSLGGLERALGPDDISVARSAYMIATVLTHTGEYPEAEPFYERALAIEEKAYGPEAGEIAERLTGIGLNLRVMGDLAGARPVLERALAVSEKVYGPDDPNVSSRLYNLALLFGDAEEFLMARTALERALAIDEKFYGPEHQYVAEDLTSLATVLANIGDYSEATRLFERALTISEKSLGPEHPELANTLVGYAGILKIAGSYADAKQIYERALSIREKKLGPENPFVATGLTDLAEVLSAMGSYAEARGVLERALAIQEKKLGAEHPDIARTLESLADLLKTVGSYAEARPLYQRALAVQEKQFGPDGPHVGECLNGLSELLAATTQRAQAIEASLRAEQIGRDHLRLTARTLPERQALRYASVRASGLNLALSLVNGLEPTARSRVWDALIRSRALVLDEMAVRHHAVVGTADVETRSLMEKMTTASQRLANLTIRGPGSQPIDKYRKMLDAVRREREDSEQALAEKSAAFREEIAKGRIGWEEVTRNLPVNSALVAFARYDRYDVPRGGAKASEKEAINAKPPAKKKPVAYYVAFVLPNAVAEPTVVPLGTAEEIDGLVSRWQDEAARGLFVAGRSADRARIAYRRAGEALRRKVWDTVAAKLGGAKRAFVVPDGTLNLVSFASLPVGKSGYLIEKGPLLHFLSAERDLVPSETPEPPGEGLLAVGGPAFDETGLFAALAPKHQEAGPSASQASTPPGQNGPEASAPVQVAALSAFRGERSGCGDFRSIRFDPLPASVLETGDVVDLWVKPRGSEQGLRGTTASRQDLTAPENETRVVELTGANASETAFKRQAPGHRILHLATHGFFLGGRCASALDSARGVAGLMTAEEPAPPPVIGENPLLLSGLALAGANHRDATGPDEEDGILTAEEIAAMDLSGVEWAVLSACDTGVGEIKAGEGVFGLRRAFQVAGARTVIMSLWSVEDESARAWMKALYEGRLQKGLDTSDAVREACLKVLRDRRARHESTHPFYWAGFVAAGAWR